MGYLFLSLAVFSGAAKGYCGKRISGRVDGFKDAMLSNFIRMLFCIIIAGVITLVSHGGEGFIISGKSLLTASLSGISTAIFVISWLISVKNGAYVMLDVFLMLGVIVASVLCKIFLGENIKPNQYVGFGILVLASYIMCSYNISLKGKFTLKSFGLVALCGIANGITSFSQKLFVYSDKIADSGVFNLYTYIFSSAVLFISYIICKRKEKTDFIKDVVLVKDISFIVLIMAVCLFANSYFIVLAAKTIPSAVLFSLSQGSALIISALMANFLFGEKANVKSVIGMLMAFCALLIINLL